MLPPTNLSAIVAPPSINGSAEEQLEDLRDHASEAIGAQGTEALTGELIVQVPSREDGWVQVLRGANSTASSPGSTFCIRLHNVRAPPTEGTVNLRSLSTYNRAGQAIDVLPEYGVRRATLRIRPHEIFAATASLDDPRAGAVTHGTIEVLLFNSIPRQGTIVVTFPKSFSFMGAVPRATVTLAGIFLPTEEYMATVDGLIGQTWNETGEGCSSCYDVGNLDRCYGGLGNGYCTGCEPDSASVEELRTTRCLHQCTTCWDVIYDGCRSCYEGPMARIFQWRWLGRSTLIIQSQANVATPAGLTLKVRFGPVRVPMQEATTSTFSLYTGNDKLDAVDMLQNETTVFIGVNTITSPSVALEDARAGALTTIRFSFEPHNFVPYLGTVCIDFPDSFRFYNPSTGWGFGGIVMATSPELGTGLVVEQYGAPLREDDHRLRIRRNGEAVVTPDVPVPQRIHLTVSNILVPLETGNSSTFNISTRTADGLLIDVLQEEVTVFIQAGRYAPSPPPSSAASSGARSGWTHVILIASTVAYLAAVPGPRGHGRRVLARR